MTAPPTRPRNEGQEEKKRAVKKEARVADGYTEEETGRLGGIKGRRLDLRGNPGGSLSKNSPRKGRT